MVNIDGEWKIRYYDETKRGGYKVAWFVVYFKKSVFPKLMVIEDEDYSY